MKFKGTIKITDFALRHFDRKFGGTKILNFEPSEVEEYIEIQMGKFNLDSESKVVDVLPGYADFCKLIPIENFTDAKVGTLPLNYNNLAIHQYIRHGYSKRREGEFSTLNRWLELPVPAPQANYLMFVLYSKEQIDKEAMAEYNKKKCDFDVSSIGIEKPEPFDADWGVVAILGQHGPEEEPMKPETFDRNYMPIEFGGSGMKFPSIPEEPNHFDFDDETSYKIALASYEEAKKNYSDEMDRVKHQRERCVRFWKENITVK